MKPGDTSDILRGPKQRAWILKLVERRQNDAVTFESVKGPLIEALQRAKTVEYRKQAIEKLREAANVVRVREPGAMPAPPEP
jgi:hypothetical protein